MERAAVSALLVLALLAAPEWFRAIQYTAQAAELRGCADCQGEPDDLCPVRAGARSEPLDEFARQRWPAAGRFRILRPSAEPECAVQATKFFGPKAPVELAAVRMSPSPPSQALLETLSLRPPIHGWPRAPPRRSPDTAAGAAMDRGGLRLSVVCWPSDHGWPMQAGVNARDLAPGNSCEWWLLPVGPGGEPELAGASFAVAEPAFPAGAGRWPRAFDRTAPLDESLFLPQAAPKTTSAPGTASTPARCGDGARERTATLDRFDQWDLQIRRTRQASLDRATLTLDGAAWTGHCQELDVLRTALERQLDCALAVTGKCQ
jgi:hypothetical protein